MRLDTIEGAILFAAQAHDGQFDQAGMPYILHPLRVGSRLYDMGDHHVIAGLLHDIVEDTAHTLDDLQALGAHPDVLETVDLLTRTDKHEPYADHITRVAEHPIAGWVKASDVADNYRRLGGIEREATRNRLTVKYEIAIGLLTDAGYDPGRFL